MNTYPDQDQIQAETTAAMLSSAERLYLRTPGAGPAELVAQMDRCIDLVAAEDPSAYPEVAARLLVVARHLVDLCTAPV